MDSIYLDHNSTTPIDPEVADAIAECHRQGYLNPASQHRPGRRARKRLEDAREAIAEIIGADVAGSRADQLIFTSGGTEANNLALRGIAGKDPGRVVISSIEHPSVVGAAEHLQQRGFQIQQVRVSADCVVDLDHLGELLDGRTRLVSIMLGNNETGVLQPVERAAKVCADLGVPLHTDAVQVVAKLAVNFRKLGVAAMSLAAHKFHGPRGIGALVIQHGIRIEPIHFGGFQQGGLRPGTESVALAVGMHKALEIWQRESEMRAARMASLRDRFESQLRDGLSQMIVNGIGAGRLPHTSNISFPGLDRQAILIALDMAGIACSTGSACASGSSEPSPVLLAMGCSREVVEGSLRFSLGAGSSASEIDESARRIIKVVNDLQAGRKPENVDSTSVLPHQNTV